MTATALLSRLQALGVEVNANEDALHLRGRTRNVTPELRAELLAHKTDILASLNSQTNPPRIDTNGDLHIPHDAPVRYRWWAGGQSIADTFRELNAPPDVWRRYTNAPCPVIAQTPEAASGEATFDESRTERSSGDPISHSAENKQKQPIDGKPKQ